MDKLQHLPVYIKLKSLFHSEGQARSIGVHLVWRMILGTTLILASTLIVLAWLAYVWAVKEDTLPFSRTSRDAFSIEELRDVIAVYEKKESEHATFHSVRPTAPSLGVGVITENSF
ncbi:MAG: hypothetical protein Q8P56_05310 [Candidatus Uhrbacteria bacterium]|nr:hypothetical protein [Candidatus Uhrbacteria bacterium]